MEEYKKSCRPIIYIDESGFAHDMPRNYGYSLKGERCFGVHDWGAKGRTNAIGALLGKELLTIGLFESNINTEAFSAWVKQELLPILPPQSIVVMDNASFHKGKWLRENIELKGHILEYLPPYSPDLNPIEHKWAQAKLLRRKYNCNMDQLFTQFSL
jgi:transposase